MNQEQYNMIKKIIISGCPACAIELCGALDNLVNGYNALKKREDSRNQVEEVNVDKQQEEK